LKYLIKKKRNSKFWEELISYFPWYDKDRIEIDASNNSSTVACVFIGAVTVFFTKQLPSNDRVIITELLASIDRDAHTDTETDARDFMKHTVLIDSGTTIAVPSLISLKQTTTTSLSIYLTIFHSSHTDSAANTASQRYQMSK
jgi:hypothetical protein